MTDSTMSFRNVSIHIWLRNVLVRGIKKLAVVQVNVNDLTFEKPSDIAFFI